ncbi:MAG TPA: tetraacyldisaccharide 4'-kinase [Candidatus Limnocylindria bacterium]|nr:tetraacyldisaccharide 4'-kinase [Candidatus Limnocylindria bacterium]
MATVAGRLTEGLRVAAAGLYGQAWELRRRAYAAGLSRQHHVAARVVSIGNLTVGGTGKTTLVLHLAERARALGVRAAVVCRNYRPGPGGLGDEARLYHARLGTERVFAGRHKRTLAAAAAHAGFAHVLVDDGFSHWPLARDLDVVLLDASDLWGGGALLPRGRLREPRRALQRAGVVVVTRLGPTEDPAPLLAEVQRYAPAAELGAARHRVVAERPHAPSASGGDAPAPRRARVVTATGNPAAVAKSAREAGFEVVEISAYRNHHWFRPHETRHETEQAARTGATLLLTAKDAVRWPVAPTAAPIRVLEVAWEWVCGGEAVEKRVFAAPEVA